MFSSPGGEHGAGSRAPHPGQSEEHLHLRHPLAHAAAHAHAEGDEAVRVVAVGAGGASQPALGDEELGVHELLLVVTGGVVTQVELGLQREEWRGMSRGGGRGHPSRYGGGSHTRFGNQ